MEFLNLDYTGVLYPPRHPSVDPSSGPTSESRDFKDVQTTLAAEFSDVFLQFHSGLL